MSLILTGFKRLRRQTRKLARFDSKVHSMMNRRRRSYLNRARSIVQSVVYSAPANPAFPRSGNLLAATSVVAIRQPDGEEVKVMLDPHMATRSFSYTYGGGVIPKGLKAYWAMRWGRGPQYYPSYVRRGIFFKKHDLAPRDYRAAWWSHFVPRFTRDVGKAIRKFK